MRLLRLTKETSKAHLSLEDEAVLYFESGGDTPFSDKDRRLIELEDAIRNSIPEQSEAWKEA